LPEPFHLFERIEESIAMTLPLYEIIFRKDLRPMLVADEPGLNSRPSIQHLAEHGAPHAQQPRRLFEIRRFVPRAPAQDGGEFSGRVWSGRLFAVVKLQTGDAVFKKRPIVAPALR
jgi:hypothetical protein